MHRFPVLSRAATASFALFVLASCSRVDSPTAATPDGPALAAAVGADDPVVLAVGDLTCGTGSPASLPCNDEAVAAVVSQVNPATLLLLGDIQYENATLSDFNTYYHPSWGSFKPITYPAPGNHEYQTTGAKGYFDYFNGVGVQSGQAGDRSRGYYSYNLGTWHLIALNSTCAQIGGCGAGSPQEQWLRADLAANPNACTVAYWHHPRFSSGGHGNNSSMQAIWQALYDNAADLVLAGHDHVFERFAPQTAAGGMDNASGVGSFVVGTGGREKDGFSTIRANSQLRSRTSFGALKLTLHPDSYDWEFVPIAGDPLVDSGTAACRTAQQPPPPPPTQTTLTILSSADTYSFKDKSGTNYGKATALLVDGSPAARTYLKFAVSGVGSKTVVSAKLRVYAFDPSDTGGRLHRGPSTSWGETSLTWSNAPSYNSTVLGTIGTVVANNWYELDVKSEINADGTVSFVLESTSTNGADFRSREAGSSTEPRLVIVVQ